MVTTSLCNAYQLSYGHNQNFNSNNGQQLADIQNKLFPNQELTDPLASHMNGEIYIHHPAPIYVKRPPTNIIVNHPPMLIKPGPVVFRKPPSVVERKVFVKQHPRPVKVEPTYVNMFKPKTDSYFIDEKGKQILDESSLRIANPLLPSAGSLPYIYYPGLMTQN